MADSVEVVTTIKAPLGEIWAALTKPDIIKTYFFGATVKTDWKPGSPITWTGEYKGKKFQDTDVRVRRRPGQLPHRHL
jgi:uncharacterized protein YndB with AHSA1/START domain